VRAPTWRVGRRSASPVALFATALLLAFVGCQAHDDVTHAKTPRPPPSARPSPISADDPAAAYNERCTSEQPVESADDRCDEQNVCSAASACSAGTCDCGCCRDTRASSQSPVSPSGHEFLTLASALRAQSSMPGSPGGEAEHDIRERGHCSGSCQHRAHSYRMWSAIMGARWADLMGFRAGPFFPGQQRCLLAVAQDNEDVQYDHALRRAADRGPEGGLVAIRGIRERLVQRFVTAALADDDDIPISDGGARQDHYRVSRAHFLFGRALHIVQDSFSSYHGMRQAPDYKLLGQVTSYVCTEDSPPHPHVTPGVADLFRIDHHNGDIIWRKGCGSGGGEACVKDEYRASIEASRELWLLFWANRQLPLSAREAASRQALTPFLEKWMAVPATVPEGKPSRDCPLKELVELERRRTRCLEFTGVQSDIREPPFFWDRKRFTHVE